MQRFERAAVLGTGVIGASWTALFLANGLSVKAYDPAEGAETRLRTYIETAWPALEQLGLTENGDPSALTFCGHAGEAVEGAQFIQENVPERLPFKHATFAEIEPHLAPDAIVASSASGLMVREMQDGWRDPSRFLLGHPFNPPHLIPLVELLTNDRTADGVLEAAEAFYAQVGKVTIRLHKEVPAHVANRLQAALWREAIHLVKEGVASLEDVDKAVWAGPGLRWAAMGPHGLFNLAAGPGGMTSFCERYRPSFQTWWDDLGSPDLDSEVAEILSRGLEDAAKGRDLESIAADRDAIIVAMLNASKGLHRT